MSKFTIIACDLCGKEIPEGDKQREEVYSLPYFYDDEEGPTIGPEHEMNLCKKCATKIRDFCKTLDFVTGYAQEENI